MSESLRIVRSPPLLEVVIDRPKANAIDAATSRRMGAVFEMFRDDPSYRVAILTGAGDRFFSAGWDLKAAAQGESYEADWGVGGFGGFTELPDLRKPVICAVNGVAAGGGFEMVLAADLVVAVDTARFLLPEALLGFPPDTASIRLPRFLPLPVAKELLLTGRSMEAEEAEQRGLVNQVTTASELMPAARRLAEQVCAAAPLAVAAILEIIKSTSHLPAPQALQHLRSGGVPSYRKALDSADAREGPRAFSEKRPPRWTGA